MVSVNQRGQFPTHYSRNMYFQYSSLEIGSRTVNLAERQHVSLNWYWAKFAGEFLTAARCDLKLAACWVGRKVWGVGDCWAATTDLQLECFYSPSLVELTGLDGPEKQDKRNNLKLSSEDHNVLVPARGLLMFWCAGAWLYTLQWIHPRSVYPQVHVTWELRNLGNVETFPSTGKTFSC